MKILMLLENNFRNDPRVNKEILSLHKGGHVIILAAISMDGEQSVEEKPWGKLYIKPISRLVWKSSVGALRFPMYFNFWRNYLAHICKTEIPDCIHVNDLPLARVGMEFSNKHSAPLVIDLHENWPSLVEISKHTNTIVGRLLSPVSLWRKYEKESTSGANAVITVVGEMKERISKLGVDKDKIIVLQNTPYSTTVADTRTIEMRTVFTIIYAGGITYHRGLDVVIRGLKILPEDLPLRLLIVGDGSYTGALKQLSAELEIEKKIEFTGRLPRAEVDRLLANCDLALIPHIRSEQSDNSSPNKLFEYMAAGIPVLSSDCISVKRVIEETGCGLTYRADSPDDFAKIVESLVANKKLLEEYSSNGRKAVSTRFNWEEGEKELLALYSSLEEKK
ncbi:MAG: glycosyltransferase family 4 protein [Bacteroidales bacterium]